MELKGKTVLVTGAAKRIGREIALECASRGAHVLIHYRGSKKEAEELKRELQSQNIQSDLFSADLANPSEVQKMGEEILSRGFSVDILVNNASVFYPTPFESIVETEWDHFMSVNLKAPFFLAQIFAPGMKKKGCGRIVNIADWGGLKPYKDYLPYCVSKGALITLTQGLAKSLAPEILVNAVCPGPILPPPDFTEKQKEGIARKTLVGHWGNPQDVARTAIFLAESDFITGQYILVEGGESLSS